MIKLAVTNSFVPGKAGRKPKLCIAAVFCLKGIKKIDSVYIT